MIEEHTLSEITARIVKAARPSRVILFGSYARGDYGHGSDIDLIVTEPEITDRFAEMVRLHGVVGDVGTGIDLLVYSDAEFEKRSRVPGTVLYWARKEGRALHGAAF
jgi:uncharacterized protein